MDNIDELYTINMPRGGYALAGGEWSNSTDASRGAPMVINSNTPGTFSSDWAEIYGASHDAFLSIVDGNSILASINSVNLSEIYRAMPNTKDDNIWEKAEGAQQIQYVVSGDTIEDARTRINSFGELEDTRGLCMRMPMMACGYGKTKEMLPLTGKDRQNPENIKLNRSEWRTGSVDLRWDNKRRVWAAYNDLIADSQGAGLGTAVYSTNADESEGFPWLKGRLEHVWFVRQPTAFDGTDGKSDGATTGEIMTHLNHRLFDATEDGAAKLSSVFIIPHKNLDPEGTPDVPHERGGENDLGGEVTGDGASIDIRSTVHFWKEKEMDGPIAFGSKISEIAEKVCCDNGASNMFIGEMIFLDQHAGLCDDVVPPAGKPPFEWVPAVRIDDCHLVGGHLGKLVENDMAIIDQLSNVCVGVNTWSKDLIKDFDTTAAILAGGIGAACDQIVAVAGACETAITDVAQQIDVGIGQFATDLETQLNTFADAVNSILLSCCEAQIDFVFSFAPTPHGFVTPKIKAKPCTILPGSIPEFPCETNCKKVKITGPCANNGPEFTVGRTCADTSNTTRTRPNYSSSTSAGTPSNVPDYSDVGDCQT